MKKRVPPSAHSKPNVTAMCIHNLRFSGFRVARIPEIRIGAPSIDGKYEVMESDSERMDTAIPHRTSMAPYPVVKFGKKLERSSMLFPSEGGLSVQFLLKTSFSVDLITAVFSY